MQISGSHLANGGAGKMTHTQVANQEKQSERLQKQGSDQQEKLSAGGSSHEQSSDSAIGKGKVILGSGGDMAIISPEYASSVTDEEGGAVAPGLKGQKGLIEDINTSHISEGVKTAAADLGAAAEELRQRDAALDAEVAQNIKDLAQSVSQQGKDMAEAMKSSNASNSANADEKSDDDSETLLEEMASIEENMMPEEQLARQTLAPAAENATRTVTQSEQA